MTNVCHKLTTIQLTEANGYFDIPSGNVAINQ